MRREFLAFGKVESVSIMTDKYSERPKGFAFVEMPLTSWGQAVIAALNGKTLEDRTLTVNVARPRSDDRGGSYGDWRGSGFGGERRGRYQNSLLT